jgi:hypothetical protein
MAPAFQERNMKSAVPLVLFLLLAALLPAIGASEAAAPRGAVHTERAAILMARKIWMSLYPDSAAKAGSEKAWLAEEKATRDGDMWEVGPRTPSPASLGSGLVFRISSADGHMLGYYNPQ